MLPDPQDTIVALASAPGPGGRAIIRLSGPRAIAIASQNFITPQPIFPGRRCYDGQVHLADLAASLPADLHLWPGPRSYTGQDIAELHTFSCPPLVDFLISQLLSAGARAAQPGEFTMRAFLAGKLDLTRAEAVLGVIEAGDRDELKQALTQLAGGVSRPLQELRNDLLDLLADVEAGLDFTEEDIHFIGRDELLRRLARALAHVTLVNKQLDQRAVTQRAFCVVLAGPPNAGKSSLFNALAGKDAALVSPQPGTTRDYLVLILNLDGVAIELVDTAGWQAPTGIIEEQSQSLGREQTAQADLVLFCLEGGRNNGALLKFDSATDIPMLTVATKCDLHPAQPNMPATSAVTGSGLDGLKKELKDRATAHARPALAPSLSRCKHHVAACLEHLRQAHAIVLDEEPPELLAVELRGVLEQLGEMVGAVYTDDLLDRIFSRFCIGK